jgi:uncharacterized protein (TIGR03066 family)
MRSFAAFLLLATFGPIYAEESKAKPAAELIVGQWRLTKSDEVPDGVTVTVEFSKDGNMTVRFEKKDDRESVTLKGTYKAEKDKIEYSLDDGDGGQKRELLVITKLTADTLATKDPKGVKEEFTRVKKDKK